MNSQIVEKLSDLIQGNIVYSFIIFYLLTVASVLLVTNYLKQERIQTSEDIFEETSLTDEGTIVFLDIAGAIERPGVYELEAGSRLYDLIKMAGGFSSSASEEWLSKYINMSSKLTDSQKIYIPFKWDDPVNATDQSQNIATLTGSYSVTDYLPEKEQPPAEKSSSSSANAESGTQSTVNVNTASQEDIDGLQGIGPVYAARIIENRPYNNLQDLTERSGVPGSVLEKIQTQISF